MGTWGVRNFENDDAMDWVSELERSEDVSVIEEALRFVAEGRDEYVEAPEACRALAAAEVVAALKGAGSPDLPDEVKQWISLHQSGSQNLSRLARLALRAVKRIKTASELKELYDESESATEWYEVINDLEARLKG